MNGWAGLVQPERKQPASPILVFAGLHGCLDNIETEQARPSQLPLTPSYYVLAKELLSPVPVTLHVIIAVFDLRDHLEVHEPVFMYAPADLEFLHGHLYFEDE